MLTHHRRLFAFDHWANRVALDAVEPVLDRVPTALVRLNHILGASRIWLARVTGERAPFDLNPSFDAAALRREFATARQLWDACLDAQRDAELAREIVYGSSQRVTLSDVLTHLPLHGQQHRGQVNTDLRAAGVTPPSIDYIHAARRGMI